MQRCGADGGELAAGARQVQTAVGVQRQRRVRVDGASGLGVIDEAGEDAHKRAHLGSGGRGRAEHVQVASEDRGVPAGTVRRSWGPHTARHGVREGGEVEGGAQVPRETREGGDSFGLDGLGQADP